MDSTTMPPQSVRNPSSPTPHRTAKLLLAVLVVLVALVALWFLLRNFVPSSQTLLPKGDHVLVVADHPPLMPVVSVDSNTGSTTVFKIEGQGTAVVVDAAFSGTSTPYYLIANPTFTASNLYAGKSDTPNAGLTQLTFSKNLKYDLTYDPSSGFAAYVEMVGSSTPKVPHVFFYSSLTQKEIDLGEGSNPTLLTDGFYLVMRQGGSIVSVNTFTGKVYPSLSIDPSAPFAVDTQNKVVALYNSVADSIDYFSIASTVSASYKSSVPVTAAPAALAFAEGKLLIINGTAAASQSNSDFTVQAVATSPRSQVLPIHLTQSVSGYKLSIQHD
ncbi:hypothetical protein H0X32_03960 [Patescibacteria group bacterium]|nr:hypothetical protein [Patescibacteria group bacterium]